MGGNVALRDSKLRGEAVKPDGYPTAAAAAEPEKFGDRYSASERIGMALLGTLGNAQTQFNQEKMRAKEARNAQLEKIKGELAATLMVNYQQSQGSDADKQALSSGFERLYGRDSIQFQTLFREKEGVPQVPSPPELAELGGGPSRPEITDEPVLQRQQPSGGLISLVNPDDPKEIISRREDDPEVNKLLQQGYIPRDKPSGRGGYTTFKDITRDGKTYRVMIDHRATPQQNIESIEQQIESGTSFLSPKTPEQQQRVAEGKARGKVAGKERQTAKIDLPKVRSDSKYLKSIIQKTLDHPAFQGMVGAPSIDKALQFVSGTEAAGFRALQQQLTGKQFLQAYETLKGAGQITEIEGEKATNALSRMRTSVSEAEFREAAEEFMIELDRLQKIAEQRASGKESAEPISGEPITPKIREGSTATHPVTKKRMIYKDGKWQPL